MAPRLPTSIADLPMRCWPNFYDELPEWGDTPWRRELDAREAEGEVQVYEKGRRVAEGWYESLYGTTYAELVKYWEAQYAERWGWPEDDDWSSAALKSGQMASFEADLRDADFDIPPRPAPVKSRRTGQRPGRPVATIDPEHAGRLLAAATGRSIEELRAVVNSRGRPSLAKSHTRAALRRGLAEICRAETASIGSLTQALGCNRTTVYRLLPDEPSVAA
jgi:hypothetical protein